MGLVREEKPSKIVNWETWPLFRFWVLEKKFYFFHLEKNCHLAIDGLSPSFVF